MHTTSKIILFLLITLFISSLANAHAQQTTTVTRIIDGDTLKVLYWGKEESIRLIGIDTPESRVNKKTKKDAKRSGQDIKTIIEMGKRATEYVESLVKSGNLITIEFDVQERDKYGRLLADVYEGESNISISDELVKNRLAVKYDGGTKKTPDNWKTFYLVNSVKKN